MRINRRALLASLASVLSAFLGLMPFAVAGPLHHHCCPECGNKTCCPTPAMIKEKKHCFRVECKDVCIPAVKGPHAPCCEPPACGRVRTVKVLKRVEYECEKCGYKWEVKSIGCQPCK